jgi:hypothetical protein
VEGEIYFEESINNSIEPYIFEEDLASDKKITL